MPALGYAAILNYKAGGQDAGGAWTPLTNCRDLTLNASSEEADVTTRAAGGWKQTEPTQKALKVEFDMVWDEGDAGFAAIRDAWLNDTQLGVQVLSAAAGEGPQFDGKVFEFKRNEPVAGDITVSVVIQPCYSTTPTSWVGA